MGLAPPNTSSAGWKRKTAVPGSSRRRPAKISASVMAMAVCPSWPQACMTPGVPDANGASSVSVSGRASMSARHATVRPGRSPRKTPTTPVSAMPVRTSSPAACRRSAMTSFVRRSRKDSSGWRWKSLRSVTRASRRLSTSSGQVGSVLLMGLSLVGGALVVSNGPVSEVAEPDALAFDHTALGDGALGQHAHGIVATQVEHDDAAIEKENVARLWLAFRLHVEQALEAFRREDVRPQEHPRLRQRQRREAYGVDPVLLPPAAPPEGDLPLLELEGRRQRGPTLARDRGG